MKKYALLGILIVLVTILAFYGGLFTSQSPTSHHPTVPVGKVIDGVVTIEDSSLIPVALEWRPSKMDFTPADKVEESRWPNGKLRSQMPIVKGMKHGISKYWHESGELQGEIPWVRGERHGIFTLFWPDGSKQADLSFNQGRPHGLATWYDEQGRVKQKNLFYEGRVISQNPSLERK